MKEKQIGEIIKIQCVETKDLVSCEGCFYEEFISCEELCHPALRTDEKNVKFVELDSTFRRVDINKFKELLEKYSIVNYDLGVNSDYKGTGEKYGIEQERLEKECKEIETELEKIFEGVID